MESTLKKTRNYFRCIGPVNELALKREECKIKIKEENGQDAGTVSGERIMGNISVRTDNGVHVFNVFFQSLSPRKKEGRIVENPQWKMACDMMEWNPEINGNGEPATVVNVEGQVSPNDYLNKQGETSYSLRWRVSKATTKVKPEDNYSCSLTGVFYINGISPEIEKEEETGRLLVNLLAVEYNGTCFPVEAIVEEDQADAFADIYEPEQTVAFDFDLISKHIGPENSKKKTFGHGSKQNVNQGFDRTELILVGGDDPIEEPESLTVENENGEEVEVDTEWINPETMRKALVERAKMLDELKKNPPNKAGNSSTNTNKGSDYASRVSARKTNRMNPPRNTAPVVNYDEPDFGGVDPNNLY